MRERLSAAVKLDMLFQFRSGFHIIYVMLSIIYIVAINQIPKAWGDVAVPFVIFSDPAVLGFFFIGGLVMLEKGQGILDFVNITPLRTGEFLLGKVLSLNIIALLASLSIATFTGRSYNLILLVAAVVLTASFFTMFGFYIALTSRSMNHYFGRVIPGMMLIVIPCFTLIGFPFSKLFYIMPSVASAKLMIEAFWNTSLVEAVICVGIMLIWNYVMYRIVIKRFDNYTIVGGGVND